MLRARDLDGLNNVAQAVCGANDLAVLNYPMKLVLGRRCLGKGTWKQGEAMAWCGETSEVTLENVKQATGVREPDLSVAMLQTLEKDGDVRLALREGA